MSRYVAIYVGFDPVDGQANTTADIAICEDRVPQRTGLLDQHGVPLYRMPETFGFQPGPKVVRR